MNLNKQPTAPLRTILSTNTLASKKSLSSIVKDLKKAEGLSAYQKRLVKKTVYNLNTNPEAVVTNRQSKAVVGVMRDRGHLKSKYHTRLGAAIHEVQRAGAKLSTSDTSKKHTDPDKPKPLSKREQQKETRRKEARMQMLARERREEEERKKRGAKYSAGKKGSISANQKASVSQEVQKAERDRNEKKAVDIMID